MFRLPKEPPAPMRIRDSGGRVIGEFGGGGGFTFLTASGRKITLDQVLAVIERLIDEEPK